MVQEVISFTEKFINMDQLKPPDDLAIKGNVDDNYCYFKQRLKLCMLATKRATVLK